LVAPAFHTLLEGSTDPHPPNSTQKCLRHKHFLS
jgi:hypothetical protein